MRPGRLLVALPFFLFAPTANATVHVAIDLTHQRMHVDGEEGHYDWPISSARSGFSTPGGSYAPTHLELMHYSKKYHMSPMPHAIFFRGGYAIHGTYATGSLGRPASHGCVRLSPGHAAELYSMVKHEGARISISGTPPASRPFIEARRHSYGGDRYASYYGSDEDAYAPRRRRRAYVDPTYASPGYDAAGYGYGQSVYGQSVYGYGAVPYPF